MKKMILALSLVLSSSAFAVVAADGIVPQVSCFTPGMGDAGYNVVLSYGGFAPHTEAHLSATTFAGQVGIGNYVVQVSKTPTQALVFSDIITRGDTFTLSMSGTPSVGHPVPAVLVTNTKAGRATSKLVCNRVIQNF
jgi:hypothetical protein